MRKRLTLALAIVVVFAMGATAATIQSHDQLFTDVPESHTHVNDIHWAAENGIIFGYQGAGGTFESGNTYGPGDPITRAQAASVLHRYHQRFGGSGGAEGPAGPQGPQGPQGPAGPAGAAGVAGYEVHNREARFGPGAVKVSVSCPEGTVALGGGFASDAGDTASLNITTSQPIYVGPGDTSGWEVAGTFDAEKGKVNVKAWVTCAQVGQASNSN